MITDLLRGHARARPDATFIVTPSREHTFGEIELAAGRFAALLETHGIGRGDHVALLAGNGAAFLVAWFGIALRGAVAVTLNTQLIADGLRYSVDQSDAKMIVADADWAARGLPHLDERQAALPRVVWESDEALLASLAGLSPAAAEVVPPQAHCTIMYTSGTTGLPKGVLNCHHAYVATGRATVQALDITASDRLLVYLPLFHVNPQMYGVMSALVAGAALILLPRFSAATFFDDAIRYGATGGTFVGTVLSILVGRHAGERRDHGLRFLFGGGAPNPVWKEVEERFGIRVHEAYGMTEVGGWSTANTVRDFRFGSCGKPRPDLEVRVVDADDRPLPPGQPGEIVVRPREPDTILSGYHRQPERMLEACRNLWFHTGDLGRFDEDGFLFYHGRMKELIRRNGEMISPVEIETALRRMPGVADCAVVGVPDPVSGDEIKVVVVAQAGEGLVPAAVHAFLSERLGRFLLPRYVEFVDTVPKTETEKIQRNKLQYLDERVHDLRTGSPCRTGE